MRTIQRDRILGRINEMPTGPAIAQNPTIQQRIEGYLSGVQAPAVPPELEAALARRQQSLGGYESEAATPSFQRAKQMAAGAEAQRQQALAPALARQGVSAEGAQNLRARMARQASQAAAGRARDLGIENLRVRGELGEAYERGVGNVQQLRNQREYMNLATRLAGEQLNAAQIQEMLSGQEAGKYLLASLMKKD